MAKNKEKERWKREKEGKERKWKEEEWREENPELKKNVCKLQISRLVPAYVKISYNSVTKYITI